MGEWKDIPLITQPYESADDVEVSDLNATIIDAIPVRVGNAIHLVKRAGLTEFVDLGTSGPVDGLYSVDRAGVALAVSNSRVFKITDYLGSFGEIFGSTELRSNSPVKFAGDATRTVMANGGKMVYTDLFALATISDADAPVDVSHVTSLDQYVLANDSGSGKVQFSDLNDLTSWQALSFFSAESKPDDVVAIDEGFREIIALGNETVEFWINDGQNPFSRIQGSAQPFGTVAPYSLALVGSTWMWLDHKRRFATMQGRQVVNVSSPFDRLIQRFSAVDNAIGYALSVDGMPLYALNFPTTKQTLVYNYVTQEWHKWGYWDTATATYDRFRGASYCYVKAWNLHLIGDHSNGKVYTMKRTTFTDNGNPIRSMLRTGHIDHGVSFEKRSDILRLKCERGQPSDLSGEATVMMRRRVNNRPQWGNERWKALGPVGHHRPYIDWRRNGNYQTCQYEFVHMNNSDLVLMGAQEYVTPLGR
jgi:hypothetical protein